MDHSQSGYRCLSSPGAIEGADAPGSQSGGAGLPPRAEVGPRAGDLHHACRIVGGSKGELLALRWSDLDFDRGRLSIERGIVRVGDDLIEQGTKTHQSRRISLDVGTVAALKALEDRMIERAEQPLLSSPPRASSSAMRSTARHHGIQIRPLELSGGSVRRLG